MEILVVPGRYRLYSCQCVLQQDSAGARPSETSPTIIVKVNRPFPQQGPLMPLVSSHYFGGCPAECYSDQHYLPLCNSLSRHSPVLVLGQDVSGTKKGGASRTRQSYSIKKVAGQYSSGSSVTETILNSHDHSVGLDRRK
jgi:hypothetical protein